MTKGRDRVHKPGVLFAAGLITGEALMGIAIAIPIVVSSRAVLAVPFHLPGAQWIGLAVLFLVGWLIYRTGVRQGVRTASADRWPAIPESRDTPGCRPAAVPQTRRGLLFMAIARLQP